MTSESAITGRASSSDKSDATYITAIDFTLYPHRDTLKEALVAAFEADDKKPSKRGAKPSVDVEKLQQSASHPPSPEQQHKHKQHEHKQHEQTLPAKPHDHEHRVPTVSAEDKKGNDRHLPTVSTEDRNGDDSHHDHSKMSMDSAFGGSYKSMRALGSGTSLIPADSPAYMLHFRKGDWSLMAHGEVKAGINSQTGPRGVTRGESLNWGMLMAERKLGPGSLMLRGMISLEPFTVPGGGSPMLSLGHAKNSFAKLDLDGSSVPSWQ